ncbi:MAG: DUF5666 domain-containing protein [Terriglobales bacterium]
MKSASSSAPSASSRFFLITLTLLLGIGITTGCGSSGTTPPKFSGNTSVAVLLASTANDQVTRFAVELQTLTLTSQSGKTVTLLSSQQPSEFMHMNAGIESLTTVTVPQDIYTSATVTLGQAVYVCIAQDLATSGLYIANYSIINQGPAINLPAPITITGSNMALLLDMQVSNSAPFPACYSSPPFTGFSMTPTFNLTPYALSAFPANSGNGKISGLPAEVASVGTAGSSSTLTVAGGPFGTRTLSVSSNNETVFQGISGASALSPGMFLNVDGAIQSDGSLLATRIALEDSSAINDSSGPLIFVDSIVPVLESYGRTELGSLINDNGYSVYDDLPQFDFSNASFNISGQLTNLQNLPFVPSFTASNMVAGQNADITSQNFSLVGGTYTVANTITLIPQTIDGTVVVSQQVGSFTDYTVSLASYDLFPTLAVQQGQTTLLNNPSQVEVYIDNSTQQLNTQPLAPGNTLRFYGLVFNDNGTLRMDCAQVNDGVTTTPQSNSAVAVSGATQAVRRDSSGFVLHTVTTTK